MIHLSPSNRELQSEFRIKTVDVRKFFLTETEINNTFAFDSITAPIRLTTSYFDTPDGRLFADQFRKTKRRFKIRSRTSTNGESVLEVKVKGSLHPKRIWLAEPGITLENGGREFIRSVIDTAFDPMFARRIEQELQAVATTSFNRSSYQTQDLMHILDFDTDVELSTNSSVATLKPKYTLLELSSKNNEILVPAEWKPRKFSKFGATLDLLTGERVRSHKLGLLEKLFEIK